MWTRAKLKGKAKTAFKANYWWCVLVAFILSLIGGGNNFKVNKDNLSSWKESTTSIMEGNGLDSLWKYNASNITGAEDVFKIGDAALAGVVAVVLLVVIISMAIGICISIFLVNPLHIGGKKFFIQNETVGGAKAGEILSCFKSGYYVSNALTMFFVGLYTFLWSLLFVIPGIIKAYEYRMIPYLLADHPEMSRSEAFARSREMMNGHKWAAFVLDLSFIGWNILSECTFGLVGIFYVMPYQHATNAELYLELSGQSGYRDGYSEYTTYTEV